VEHLAAIDASNAEIDALNRSDGPVWALLPALVERSNHQRHALENALQQLTFYGPIQADEDDLLLLHGRLNTLAAKRAAR
jgi:hypothetical protein